MKNSKISKMINQKCPWCNEVFDQVGTQLVGIDQTPKRGEKVLWFHLKCKDAWENSKEFDVRFNGIDFVKVPRTQNLEN